MKLRGAGGVGEVELEIRDLLVRSRTIKSHKLMNRRHMPLSNPLSIGHKSSYAHHNHASERPQGSPKRGKDKTRDIDCDGRPYRLRRHEQCLERRKKTISHTTGEARMALTAHRASPGCA
jgi:hypothetical protein